MKKIFAIVITLSVLTSVCFTGTIFAEDKTVVIACSDFQPEYGNSSGKTVLEGLVNSLKNEGITSADGFLCCGDYDYEYTETKQGIDTVKETVKSIVDTNMVFVQGNHDSAVGTDGISYSGNNDPENGKYGVFVINEDDYMWHNSDEETIKNTAQNLIDYLNRKIRNGYDNPIFIVSHLALNYNMRTKYDGDGMHANYIFDVLNEAGKKGLNIIYLFGHDHSNGWDDYLGGAAIYLEKGDKILIAQNSQTVFKEETLNFTYMNAGYIGYYRDVNDGADTALTMTSFEFTDKELVIARYDNSGKHNLKSAGVRNEYQYESSYSPDTRVYSSPRTVTLTDVTDTTLIANLIERPQLLPSEKYVKVTSLDNLKDGGKYIIVYNDTNDYIMLPEVKYSERIGFKAEATTAFGANTVVGDYKDKLWTLNKSGTKWTLESGGKYAALTNTSDYKITATLENTPTEFKIEGNADYYTFVGGNYYFNYNSRGLINGYESPSYFYIYEYQKGVELKADKTQSGIDCEITVNDIGKDANIIVAAYLDEKFVCIPKVISSSEKGTKNFTISEEADTLKVFVWDGLANIIPLMASEFVIVD